jgi:hypothetical protein
MGLHGGIQGAFKNFMAGGGANLIGGAMDSLGTLIEDKSEYNGPKVGTT